jgi:hypothetical protein
VIGQIHHKVNPFQNNLTTFKASKKAQYGHYTERITAYFQAIIINHDQVYNTSEFTDIFTGFFGLSKADSNYR